MSFLDSDNENILKLSNPELDRKIGGLPLPSLSLVEGANDSENDPGSAGNVRSLESWKKSHLHNDRGHGQGPPHEHGAAELEHLRLFPSR